MDKIKKQLLSIPFYLFLLPVFFVIHGLVENYPLTGFEILKLLGIYTGVALLLFALFWLIFKNICKASFFAFCVLAFQLFFGSAHDFLKENLGAVFLIKYSFLVPFAILVLGTSILFAKRSGKNFIRPTKYLNILLLVLVPVDAATLMLRDKKVHKEALSDFFLNCDTCRKPDVYLIIADEYAGKQQLKDIFSFDNFIFENALRNRGFYWVENSRSNYNYTVYSTASLLNMQYIKNLKSNKINQEDFLTCRQLIYKSDIVKFFSQRGYEIYNCSFFDLEKRKRATTSKYFPPPSKILTAQTFTSRVNFDLGFHFASSKTIERILKHNLYNIQETDSLTKKIASLKTIAPKFVYTHLMMPHHPYYFDKDGRPTAVQRLEDIYKEDRKAYISYLQYTNKKLLELIDHIKKKSSGLPVIVLMSDHGFRQSGDNKIASYQFITLNAVYLPNGNYSGFYNGISHVNQFRALLNSQFGQKLPLLKDSSIFIRE